MLMQEEPLLQNTPERQTGANKNNQNINSNLINTPESDLSHAHGNSSTTINTNCKNVNNNTSEHGRNRIAANMIIKNRRNFHIVVGCISVLSFVSVIILIVGVYRYSASAIDCKDPGLDRLKLERILNDVKRDYFTIYPNEIYADPAFNMKEAAEKFIPYDCDWRTLKSRTDHAFKLRQRLKGERINTSNLRPREKKAYAQLDHYLGSVFGNPYGENYYAGDWMMGPNYFCWQQICYVPHSLGNHFDLEYGFVPENMADFQKIIKSITKIENTYRVYRENMELGVKAGMVRSVEDCKAGLDAFANKFKHIVKEGPTGIREFD